MDGFAEIGIGDKVELNSGGGGMVGMLVGIGASCTGEPRYFVKWSFNKRVSGPIHGGLFRKAQAFADVPAVSE